MPRNASAQQLQFEAPALELSQANGHNARRRRTERRTDEGTTPVTANASARRPSSVDLLATPGALLTRSHLRQLGLERRAIDAVFRALPVVAIPGYSRPMIRAEHFHALVEQHTYGDDRVRPCHA